MKFSKKRKSKISGGYHTLTLTIDAGLDIDQTGVFSAVFEDLALSSSCRKEGRSWEFLWTLDHAPEAGEIARRFAIIAELTGLSPSDFLQHKLEELDEARDWVAESYQALPAFSVGPFFIYGSHHDGAIPADKIPMLIEAATAFGSGSHGTTSECLQAIQYVKDTGLQPNRILDMGCGSGILAIGAAKLWPDVTVDAADNDQECVRVTDIHCAMNKTTNIETLRSEGYAPESAVWGHAPYDFIIANILAGPLIEMAQDQCRALASGGYLILSGTLETQGGDVLAAYTPLGLTHIKTFPKDEWVTLLLQKTH